jgi:Family of unknown function (DUF6011)
MQVNTETRVGRMLDGVIQSDNKGAKVVVTVSLFNDAERRFHEPFQLRAWDGRDGRMLTVGVHGSGDWANGVKPISVIHVDTETGREFVARDPRNENELLRYAARAALQYATTGELPSPKNGRVEASEWMLCGRCGRELTHPDSIAAGIGPECRGQDNRGQTILARERARNPEAVAVEEAVQADAREQAPWNAPQWRSPHPMVRRQAYELVEDMKAQRTAEQDEAEGTDVFGAPLAYGEPTGSQLLRQMTEAAKEDA